MRWLWRWGIADRQTAGTIWGVGRSATFASIAAMKKLGLIEDARISGMPSPVLHMTPVGANLVEQYMPDDWREIKPVIYSSRINAGQVQHDLLVQKMVLKIKADDYKNDRYYRRFPAHFFYKGGKIPDAVVFIKGQKIAIEVIENLPRPEEQKRLLWLYAEAHYKKRLNSVIFASTNPALLKRLKITAKNGCGVWSYNSAQRRWYNIDSGKPQGDLRDFVDTNFINNAVRFRDLSEYTKSLYQVLIK